MTPLGMHAGTQLPDAPPSPSSIGAWPQACQLLVGWHVQLGDGRWVEVLSEPETLPLGRVGVEVSWMGGPPESASWGWQRRVFARTPVQYAAYLAAVEKQLEGTEQ